MLMLGGRSAGFTSSVADWFDSVDTALGWSNLRYHRACSFLFRGLNFFILLIDGILAG